MSYKGLPEGLLARLSGGRVRRYAEATGWSPLGVWNDALAVYQRGGPGQLLVPLRPDFDDYPLRLAEAVDRLAEAERRPPAELLEELLLPPADRLAFLPDGEAVP